MMKKFPLWFIIGLLSVALLGLVAIQLYWVKNAADLREDQFNRSVHEALRLVVKRLEQHEAMFYISKRIGVVPGDASVEEHILKGELPPEAEGFQEEILIRKDSAGKPALEVKVTRDKVPQTVPLKKVPEKSGSDLPESYSNNQSGDSALLAEKKKTLVNKIVNELVYVGVRNIEERVDPKLLDSLLRAELEGQGVKTNFEFNVFSHREGIFVFSADKNQTHKLENSPFFVNLFPNDVYFKPDTLIVYFPEQSIFLLRSMWLLLVASGLFVIIIIGAFFYTIKSLLKQKKISEIRNDFVNNMTHEFKTPVSTISLACEALEDPAMSSDKSTSSRYLDIIRKENRRLGTLIERVLQTAVLDKGTLKLKREPLSIHQLIHEAMDNIALQAKQRNAILDFRPSANKDQVSGDRIHLTNVIYNLLENALKYSTGIPDVTIETKNSSSQWVEIIVRDKGIGIKREDQRRIFEKLYRVPTGNVHDVKGFGLGLSYVKAIVELHAGEVMVDSEPGHGSEFVIKLPLYNE